MQDGVLLRRLPAQRGHAERVDDEFGAHVFGDGPADDPPGPGVHHRGDVHLSLSGGMLGNVGQPQPVWPGDGELPVDQVFRGGRRRLAAAVSAPVEALQAGLAHEPGDPLVVHRQAQTERQLGVHPRPPVGATRVSMDLLNMLEQ
jgi:hypothetical protein